MFLMLASSTEQMKSVKSVLLNKLTGDQVDPDDIQKALEEACKIEVDNKAIQENTDFLEFTKEAFKQIGPSKLSLKFLLEDAQITNFPLKEDALRNIFSSLSSNNNIVKISEDGTHQTVNVGRARVDFSKNEIITSNSAMSAKSDSTEKEEKQATDSATVEFTDTSGDGKSNLSHGVNELTQDQLNKLLSDLENLQDRASNDEFKDNSDASVSYTHLRAHET